MEKYFKNLSQGTNNFKEFNKIRLHIDKELYKKGKYDTQKPIAVKKQALFDEKLSESVGKAEELWNAMKYPGMSKKTLVSNFNAIDNNKSLTYDIKTMSKVFKDFFSNPAESFIAKLPDPLNKFNLEYTFLYYSNFANPEVFHIKSTSEKKIVVLCLCQLKFIFLC